MEITGSTLETVEMSEIDGTELSAVIRCISLPMRALRECNEEAERNGTDLGGNQRGDRCGEERA